MHSNPSPTSPLAAFLGLVLLGVLLAFPGMLLFLDVPWTHLGRYALAGVLLALGLACSWNLTWQPAPQPILGFRPRSRPVRLGGLALGLGLAAAVWLFLPPFQDVALWSAWAEAEALADQVDELRPGDRDGFDREKARRESLKKGFPELGWLLTRAEDAWTERTNEAIAELDARIEAARKEVDALLGQKKYAEIGALGERIWNELHEEAAGLGRLDVLKDRCCDLCKYIALLWKHASKRGSAEAGKSTSAGKP
jgi:hypothetical protein